VPSQAAEVVVKPGGSDALPPPSAMRAAPAPAQMPPTSLSALSSMSSTQLPQGAATVLSPQSRPELQPNPNLRASAPVAETTVAPKPATVGATKTLTTSSGNSGLNPVSVGATPTQAPTQAPVQPPIPTAGAVQGAKPGPVPASSPNLIANSGSKPATTSTTSTTIAKPQLAKTKKSWMKFLPFAAIGLVVLVAVGFLITRLLGGNSSQTVTPETGGSGNNTGRTEVPSQQISLEYWGLWEPSQVLEQVISDFQTANPGVTVRYTKQSHQDYRERLQTAVSSGNGPDVFRFHASWVPMMRNDLQPLPASVISTSDLQANYYPVAAQQLQSGGQPVGVPLMYEGLALLYNKDIFETSGLPVPQTWAELRTTAAKLVVKSGNTLERGGIALGNSTNVDHFSDILGLLMLQNGADPSKPNSQFTSDALTFYTNFQAVDGVWNQNMPTSTVAFARGEVAMIFAPSWRVHDVLSINPELNFGVAPVPKLSDERIAWANYWAEGVSARSKNKEAAQNFLKYISQPAVLEKLYASASQVRSFGEVYPRKDMADKLANNEYVYAYLQDAPYAQSWYMSSSTHDNGINDQIIKYYEDAVTAVVGGKKAQDVIGTIDLGTAQVLRQYNVNSAN
jgi:multiple sugar transport system substrate-binding protein